MKMRRWLCGVPVLAQMTVTSSRSAAQPAMRAFKGTLTSAPNVLEIILLAAVVACAVVAWVMKGRQRSAKPFVLLAVCALVVLGGVRFSRARAAAQRAAQAVSCQINMTELARAMALYESDKEEYPPSLADLYPDYADFERAFVCPSDKNPVDIGNGLRCSYVYLGAATGSASSNTVILYEAAGNHARGRNCVYKDGSSRCLSEEEFRRALAHGLADFKERWESFTPEQQRAIEQFCAEP